MKPPKTIIKKYENRRLYDATASRYVNLDDVAQMIRAGAEVQVVDAKTGKDLTRVILTEIIVEDARGREALPVELLRQLVAASDRATHEFLTWLLTTSRERLASARTAAATPLEFLRHLLPGLPWPAESSELEQLRRRVEELEQQLAARGRRKKSAGA